jgi:hypothetical protein
MKSKDWVSTPYSHSGQVAKSRTGSGDLKHNGTRKEKMTSVSHFKATSADEALSPIPARTKSHNLDTKMEPAPATYGDANMIGQPKSGEKNLSPAVDKLPSRWPKRGYRMDVPSTLGSDAPRLAKKWS